MPIRPLPTNPSLENLKNHAKQLHKSVHVKEGDASAFVREFHPHTAEALADFQLADAQLVIARSYGFITWTKLKQYLATIKEFVWNPPPDSNDSNDPATKFLRLACLNYGNWNLSMAEQARRLLRNRPGLARTDLYTACAVGHIDAVRDGLTHDQGAVNRKGGALHWEPLLYCCYSRINSADPKHSTLEVVKLLLANGADPNAGFLWRGNIPAFTALTGAFGEGEAGAHNPPHQYRDELVRLLLDAGADPNDGQALYNTGAPVEVLRLLFSYGLGQDKRGPWLKRTAERLNRQQMLQWELWRAARNNEFGKVNLLVENGVEVNQRSGRENRTPYQEAILAGNADIAQYLLDHGAEQTTFDPKEQFASACVAGQREEALGMLQSHTDLMHQLGEERRSEIVHKAAASKRSDAVRLIAELGFDLNALVLNRTALHDAAWKNDVNTIKLLIELGADPTIRDRDHEGTALDWAEYNQQREAAEYLRTLGTQR